MERVDPELLQMLACPVTGGPLRQDGGSLVSQAGARYPVIEGVPVLLVDDVEQTLHVARASLDRAKGVPGIADTRAPDLYLETLGISDDQKDLSARIYNANGSRTAVISSIIAATSGYAYVHLITERGLSDIPIPRLPLPPGNGARLLDVGCNWGRWSIAAARRGYRPVGIDPSLGAVLDAKDLCQQLGVDAYFVVADARFLPFQPDVFDDAFSYSVLQHLSEEDAQAALASIAGATRSGGTVKIQMAAKYGVRSLQHQAKRRFAPPKGFQVRYWTVPSLLEAYTRLVGPTRVSVDCYFGLGWQFSDWAYMRPLHKPILLGSEILRRLSQFLPPMRYVADSVFLHATVR